MTDHIDPADEPTAAELEAIRRLLSDEAMWAEPSSQVQGRVLATITAATPQVTPGPVDRPAARRSAAAAPNDLAARRKRRRGLNLLPLAAAAAVAAIALGALAIFSRHSTGGEVQVVALAGTDAAPGASAVARIEHLANGDQILLDVSGLPAAPDGACYTVWVIRAEPTTRVPAGSFHMRGGDAEIEFWSGVSTELYRTVSVTLNTEDDPAGAGEVVLRGELEG